MSGDASLVGTLEGAISIVVTAATVLASVALGAYLTARRDKAQRRLDFVERQLREFYSPLLALRRRIQGLPSVRERVWKAEMEAWQVECERLKGYPEALRKLEEKWEPEMQKSMDYDSKKAYEEWLADYRKMIDIFCEKEWLAEPSTVQHFSALYEYVEIWNRYAAESIPREALAPLKHSEEPLLPLFEDLQKTHDKLRERLARG